MGLFSQTSKAVEYIVERLVFGSRWLQAPVYIGLIIGAIFYAYKFIEELIVMGQQFTSISEVEVMLMVLGLIDVSMVMNLLVIVIIGGYTIFTSRIDFDDKEDRPHWLDHINADRLKVKLATSLASISGVHLLKTFIDIHTETIAKEFYALEFEIVIHMVFIVSALVLAWIAKLLEGKGELKVGEKLFSKKLFGKDTLPGF